MNDTIAAISTALGVGAISIIRVSGENAIPIVNKIFKGKNLLIAPTHTIHYGHIINDKGNIIDEVLVTIMKKPKTFTKEDIVEINCHGGIITTNKVLELLIQNKIRLAEPGEFTKRAFLNGRIDLIEAEGIMNLISAKTETSRKLSINQLQGEVSKIISAYRKKLIAIISQIEVKIDYPEYEDIEELESTKLMPQLINLSTELDQIITKSEEGKLLSTGIKVGIIGRPNVGKSSLLNALLEEEKAIVTDIPGTTRDIVEGTFKINNIEINLIDTAGIRKTNNPIEEIGIKKSIEIINKSDIIILILNNNELITEEDKKLFSLIKSKRHIIVINKTDLPKSLNEIVFKDEEIIKMSIKNKEGIDILKQKIIKMFNLEEIKTEDMTYLTTSRSIGLLKQAREKIEDAISSINVQTPIDITELEIKECWSILGEIIGETYTDELLDNMFKMFCLGK